MWTSSTTLERAMTNASRARVDHLGLHRGELTEHPLPRSQGADGITSMIGKLIVATLLTAGCS